MKFIKYAVGLVIALSVIPLVVVTVTNLDASRLKTVEFEVIDVGDITFTFSENTFNDIHSLIIYTDNIVSNLITTTVNDVEVVGVTLSYVTKENFFSLADSESIHWEELKDTNIAYADGYTPTVGDKWTMTFEVSIMPPHIKLLIGLVPLIFVGGILLFMLDKRKKED